MKPWYIRTVKAVGQAVLMAALVAASLIGGRAHADDHPAIAVLPLEAADESLALYGMPVAKVLAGKLSSAVDQPVRAWSAGGTLPARIDLVIDGRIVNQGPGAILLEARVRDPGRGQASAQVATRSAPLTEVDRLADELAHKLVVEIERVKRERKARRKQRPSRSTKRPATTTATATRPIMLMTADREPIVTDAMAQLVRRLGFNPRLASFQGIAGPDLVRAELKAAGAGYALLHEVQSVDYDWEGVLTARGLVRVVLVDGAGRPRYDRMIETDTLVGSRGDRHAALLGFLVRQVTDAAWPRLRKVVAR